MKIIILTYAKDHFEPASIRRLLDEAKQRGHDIIRVRYNECSMSIEDNVPKVYYRGEELRNVDAVIPWIIQRDFNYGMDVLRQFEAMGVFVLNSADAFTNACHKWRTAQVLGHSDIPTPDTYRANEYNDMYKHIDSMSHEEAVIKISTGTRGSGVMLSKDKDMTKSIAATLGICRDSYIVQEFVRESYGTDIRVYVVGDQVVAAMERRAENGFRSNLHLGGKGTAVELQEDEIALAIRTARALGLNSAGIDFMRSEQGLCVIEANTSGEFGIEKLTHSNVAGAIIEYIEHEVRHNSSAKA